MMLFLLLLTGAATEQIVRGVHPSSQLVIGAVL